MKVLCSILTTVATFALSNASDIVIPRDGSPETEAAVAQAATAKISQPNSPSGGYSPGSVACPDTRPTIRQASSLSPDEISWLEKRRNNTVEPMISFLSRMNISGFDVATYINRVKSNASTLPNIGIAVSGGGYRALMNGAGFIAASDNRTKNSTDGGQIGGLLQASTYLAGLSGGGWLVGSIYTNNFSSVQALQDGSNTSSVWQFENSVFEGPSQGSIPVVSNANYFMTIVEEVQSKNFAGYETSITDYWGRALSYQLVNDTNGGPAYTFSSITLTNDFINGEIPMPFLVADNRAPNTIIISLNSTVFEINPFEIGSWDPSLYGFVPTRYLGSNFSAGVLPESEMCVEGFDQAGYVVGASSTLFNTFLLNSNSSAIPSFLSSIFANILANIGEANKDLAQFTPNPFYHFNNDSNRNANYTQLTLVDGGEDLQNIPFYPLIQQVRGVDIIFAVDSSSDTTNFWPNGTSLVATYQRSLNDTIKNGTAFPSIPDQNTFINLGLNTRPTFFGCDPANITSLAPLIVYIPNAPYIEQSNVSTFDPAYSNTQRNAIIRNGYNIATMGNGTLDSEWPTCVACAVISRSLYKTNTSVPTACNTCFTRYCWNGTVNSTTPSNYNPNFFLTPLNSQSEAPTGTPTGASTGTHGLGISSLVWVIAGMAALVLV